MSDRQRLEIGQRIRTSYGTGPYRITSIVRGCTCKDPLDFFDEGPDLAPHIHLMLKDADEKDAWVGFYDEETLKSVRCDDTIIVLDSSQPIQESIDF